MYRSISNMKRKCLFMSKSHLREVTSAGDGDGTMIQGNRRNHKDFHKIPGPKSYRFVGTLYKYLPLVGDYNAETLDQNAWLNYHRYGPLTRESLMPGAQLLHVFDPDDIADVFRQEGRYPSRRSHLAMKHYRENKPHVYNTGGLLSTNGPEWWKLRSAFQKNFTSPQSVKGHVTSTDEIAKEFVQWIRSVTASSDIEDFLPYLNRLNLEVIGKVAFNERFNSFVPEEQDENSRSSKVISAAFGSNAGVLKLDKGFLWKFMRTPLYNKLAESQEYLETVATDILYRHVNFYDSKEVNKSSNHSLLESFLQQPNVDLKDLKGMLVDILMASIDTTAYSTSFLLYHLARNKQTQQKLYEEVSTLLPANESSLNAEILVKAGYVRSCVKESLRLNPVSIGVGRVLQRDIVLRGYLIPKDTVIVTQNMVASRLPQYVNDPLTYKPERWLRDSQEYESIHPFLSIPFGFGPRSCIARRLAEQNMSIALIRLVRDFKLHWNGGEMGVRTHLINKPNQPIQLSFEPRSHTQVHTGSKASRYIM